jgi:hypothetical protein
MSPITSSGPEWALAPSHSQNTLRCSHWSVGDGNVGCLEVVAQGPLILVITFWLGVGSTSTRAEGPDELSSLSRQVQQLYGAGKYVEATEIAQRALAERQFGPNHPTVAGAISWLAGLYRDGAPHCQRPWFIFVIRGTNT